MSLKDLESILYVDDEPDLREVATMALEAVGGFDVTAVSSGAEALIKAQTRRHDLFLLDVMMPVMDGPATLKALRSLPDLVDVPVVFITAKAHSDELDALRALGAAGIISKPFDPMRIADQLREIWENAHGDGR